MGLLLASTAFGASPAFAQAPAADAGASSAEQADGAEQELVVTARRREERLLDVPMSISVIGGDRLEALGSRNFRDIGSLFPGVSFNDSNGSGGEFSIRGLTSAGSGSDTSIGLYVDEVFVGNEASMSQRLFDLRNVQVLRGPQGTLFGRNTVAGAINIVTRKPEDEFAGSIEGTIGNYDLRQIAAMLNVPVVPGRLAFRINYADRQRDGYLRNLAVPGSRGNDENGHSLRAHLLARPTDTLDILVSADDSRDETCENMFKVISGTLFSGNTDPDESAWDGACQSDRHIRGLSLRADQRLGGVTVTSISAYRKLDTSFLTDRDFTAQPILHTGLDTDESQFTQELRISGSGGRFNWTAGLFYFERDYFQNTILDLGPGFLGPGRRNLVNAVATTETQSIAGFVSGEYRLTDRLRVELGIRYTYEDKSLDYEQTATFPIPGFGLVPAFSKDVDGGDWSPTLTLSYALTPNSNLYGRLARGFKSGGFNAGPSSDPARIEFSPEYLTSYEAGYRTTFLDGRGNFQGSVFYLDYKNIQQSDQDGAGFFISNAASARSYGVETQLALRLSSQVSINAGLGYINARYRDFGLKSGNRLPRSPEWTGSFAVDLRQPLGSFGTAFLIPELTYRSANYVDSANTELFKQPSNTLINIRAGIEGRGGWSVAAWVRNLTDERFTLGGFSVAPILHAVTLSPPRTFGVDVRWSF